jgi:hypothetical protein
MLRDVHQLASVQPDFAQVARVLDALAPLILADAVASLDEPGARRLRDGVAALEAAREGDLRGFVRASLEVFATVVSLPATGILAVMAASLLRSQIAALPGVVDPIDPDWRDLVDQHAAAVSRMVHAVVVRDLESALRARRDPDFLALFAALVG